MSTQDFATSRIVILAAVDTSETSTDVLRTAAMLGQRIPGVELHLLHVIEPVPDPEGHNALVTSLSELLDSARVLIDETTGRAREHFTGRIVGHLAIGTAWREIVQLGVNLQADLVVVGSRRRPMVERWLLGSVSEQVVRKASCAVLVARPKDVQASAVPEVEPPCTACLETQRDTAGETLWCSRHDRKRQHPRGHVHYEVPASFAVGSLLLRPEG